MFNFDKWKEFRIGDLFEIKNGIKYPSYFREHGSLPLVSTTNVNNGISDYIADRPEKYKNFLTVAYSGSVGATFYHADYVFVGETVFALIPKFPMTKNIGLFLCSILRKHNEVYTYGRKIIGSRYVDDVIKLPANKCGNPDWELIDSYIDSIESKQCFNNKELKESLDTNNENPSTLDTSAWKLFTLNELFDIKYGINLELLNCELDANGVNFVARTSENNGVTARVKVIEGKEPQAAGLITVAGGGSVLSAFLQEEPFYSGRDLYVLKSKCDIDRFAKLFILALIRKEKYRYSYGRQANKTLPFLEIKLPVKDDGKPDYDFMSQYMKTLPFADRI